MYICQFDKSEVYILTKFSLIIFFVWMFCCGGHINPTTSLLTLFTVLGVAFMTPAPYGKRSTNNI